MATNIPFLQAVLDDPDFRAGARHDRLHRGAPAAARTRGTRPTAAPSCCTYLADVTVNQPHGAAPGRRRPARQAARPSTSTRRAAGRLPAAAARARPGGVRRRPARAARPSRSPTRPSATPTSRCSPPGCAPATCSRVAPHVARTDAGAAVAGGLGRRDLRRRAALPGRGPVGAAGRAARGACRTSACRCCCAAATPSATPPYPTEVDRRVRARGRRHRHRHLPDLRRAQRRRPDAPGDRGGARDRHGGRRGRALLHRRPVRPGARSSTRSTTTCGWPSRSSRPARTCWRSRTWPACCAPPRRAHAGHRAARAVRPAGAPAHPRHRRRPARHAARRDRRRASTRSTRAGASMAGTTSPAVAVGAGRRHRPHRPRHRAVAASGLRPGALLGGGAPGLRAVRVRACLRRPAASTTTRSPAASCPTCASRPSRSASATGSRTIEDMYAAADRILGRLVKVTPSSKVVGDLALHLVGAGADPADFEAEPGTVRHPRLGHRLPARRARRPARRLARAVPHQGAGGPAPSSRRPPSCPTRTRAALARPTRGAPSTGCCSPARPRSSTRHRETYGDLSVLPHRATTSTA